MINLEKFRQTMALEVLQSWAVDAEANIAELQAENERQRQTISSQGIREMELLDQVAALKSWQESMKVFLTDRMIKVESINYPNGWAFKNMPLYGDTAIEAVESALCPRQPLSGEQSC